MEEKLRFVFEHELRERARTELCERYEITRQTGYVWLRRYREAGVAGLVQYSRAAHRHHNQMREEVEQRVLQLRQGHMRWVRGSSSAFWSGTSRGAVGRRPAPGGALLQGEGLVVPRRKRVRTAPYREPLAMDPTACGARISRAGSELETGSASIADQL
jgi:putative transposase